MKRRELGLWVLWWILAGAVPAFANNPPTPDGMLGVVLIFPVAILALRLAGAKLPERSRKRRLLAGLLLTVATILTMGGTEIALIPLLVLLSYGVYRSGSVMRHGQGGKRFAIGTFLVLYVLFAIANYLVSLNISRVNSEERAVTVLRAIIRAQEEFRSSVRLDADQNGAGEYGTVEQLVRADLVHTYWGSPEKSIYRSGYRFFVVLSGDPARDEKLYFVYASPVNYGSQSSWSLAIVESYRESRSYGRQTFASDETGVIRQRDLQGSRAVTREETASWERIQ